MIVRSGMMARYWFKPHAYGYGAMPVTWEGWAVTLAALAIIFACSLMAVGPGSSLSAWIIWLAVVSVTIVTLLSVSRRKTDGAWRWRWGDRETQN